MDLITIDFETYYDKKFSLSKLTTEEYIRSSTFEVIGVGVKVNNQPTEWASGDHDEIKQYLQQFNWQNAMLVGHNNMFDGAILNWCFAIRPRAYSCTLCIARALHGVQVSGSLAAVAERYGVGIKGTEVQSALGKKRSDFRPEELDELKGDCTKLKEKIGWTPDYSFEQMIDEMIDEELHNGYDVKLEDIL